MAQFNDYVTTDQALEVKKKKRKQRWRGKLKKAGFDVDELSPDFIIRMNRESFKSIEEEQMRTHRVTSSNPDFKKLDIMREFSDGLVLRPEIWEALERYDIISPTPVQKISIPYLMHTNNDVVIEAQIGCGKTLTFLLPAIEQILKIKKEKSEYYVNNRSPYVVIVTPRQELTQQIAKDAIRLIGDVRGINAVYSTGGQDMRNFYNDCKTAGCDILVATPGRLSHSFLSNHDQSSCMDASNIMFVVLDEADALANNRNSKSRGRQQSDPNAESIGSFREIITDFINLVTKRRGNNFRIILSTATMEEEGGFLYSLVERHYIHVKVGERHPVYTIGQSFVEIGENIDRLARLSEIIDVIAEQHDTTGVAAKRSETARSISKIIIFVNEKITSDRVAHTLRGKGFIVSAINSDRSSRQRYDAVANITRGDIDILVATDVLSRGINVPKVDYIINYQFPNQFNAGEYIHRIGRCGRIGNFGKAITLFDPAKDGRYAQLLIEECRAGGQEIPDILLRCVRSFNQLQRYSYQQPINDYHHQNPINQQRVMDRGENGFHHSNAMNKNGYHY